MPVKYTDNGDGTLTQETDGGYRALVIDPDGSFHREMTAPAGLAETYPATGNIVAPGSVQPPDPLAGMTPEARAAIASPDTNSQTANPTPQPLTPTPTATVAPLPSSGSSGPQASLVPSPAAAPAMATKTDRQTTVSTEGLDEASKKDLKAAHAKTQASSEDAIEQNRQAAGVVNQQQADRAKQDYMSGYVNQVGALDAQQKYKTNYEAALKERQDAQLTKLDPSKAFGNEKNSWGIIAGLEGALAALDEGIARLKGGHAPPSDLITRMVNQSLQQQEDERKHRIEAAGESADVAHEEMLKARGDAHEAAAQMLEARKALATNADQAAFLDAQAADQRVQRDKANEDFAKSVATKRSVQNTTKVETGPAGGAGAGKPPPERNADQAKAQSVIDMANDFYTKAGLVRGPDGKWKVGEGALPPAVYESVNPFSDDTIHAAGKQLAQTYGRFQSGGQIGEKEEKEFSNLIGLNTMTRAQLAARANTLETSLQARLKSSDAAANQVDRMAQPVERY